MEKVEVVVRDLQDPDKGVVAQGEENRWNKVKGGQGTSSTSQSSGDSFLVVGQTQAVCEIAHAVDEKEDEVPATRECSVVDGRGELKAFVMLLLP